MKKIVRSSAIMMTIVLGYIAILMVGQAIPREFVIKNVQTSYEELKGIGLYYSVVRGAEWDNWTDALFLNSTVTEFEGNLFEKAMANAYTISEDGSTSVIENIKLAISDDENTIVYPYTRYWAGNMTLFKILLIFMPLSGIRSLLLSVTVILLIITIFNIKRSLGVRGVVPFLISILVSMYIPNAMCLVYSSDILIMLLAINVCCMKMDRNDTIESYYFMFLLIGSVTAYINYWAFPLITLGMPLVFLSSVKLTGKYDSKVLLKENVLMSIFWTIGLCGTVLMKQLLCFITFGTQSGTEQLSMRMGSGFSMEERLISTTQGVINELSNGTVLLLIIVFVICFSVLLRNGMISKRCKTGPLLVIACYPVVWWFLFAGHGNHGFVKYMYGVSYYALFSAAILNCKMQGAKLSFDKKQLLTDILVIGVWAIFTSFVFSQVIHYDKQEVQQWSLDTTGFVKLEKDQTAVQQLSFDVDTPIYLKNVKTILVNITEDEADGVLCVAFAENGNVVKETDIPVKDITAGDWFSIPIEYAVNPENDYQVMYSAKNFGENVPYLLLQDVSQGAPANKILSVNEETVNGVIANQYEFDTKMLSWKPKLAISLIFLLLLQIYVNRRRVSVS